MIKFLDYKIKINTKQHNLIGEFPISFSRTRPDSFFMPLLNVTFYEAEDFLIVKVTAHG